MVNQLIFQLSLPLGFLGTIYSEMRQNLLDMEALYKLVEENPPLKVWTDLPFLSVSISYNINTGQARCSSTPTQRWLHPIRERQLRVSPRPTNLPEHFIHRPRREEGRHRWPVRLRQIHCLQALIPVLRSTGRPNLD
jgi:hypothetical protein